MIVNTQKRPTFGTLSERWVAFCSFCWRNSSCFLSNSAFRSTSWKTCQMYNNVIYHTIQSKISIQQANISATAAVSWVSHSAELQSVIIMPKGLGLGLGTHIEGPKPGLGL